MTLASLDLPLVRSALNYSPHSRLAQNKLSRPLTLLQLSLRHEARSPGVLSISINPTVARNHLSTQIRSFVWEPHRRLAYSSHAFSPPAFVLLDAKPPIWGPRKSNPEHKPVQKKHSLDRPKCYTATKRDVGAVSAPVYTSPSTKIRSVIGASSAKTGSRITARPIFKRAIIAPALTLKYESRIRHSESNKTHSHPAFVLLYFSRPIWGPRKMATELEVWTDGACSDNGKRAARAGYGVFFGLEDPRNEAGRVPGLQANNRGELLGIIRALEIAQNENVSRVKVYTDSQYVIRCIAEWIPTWIHYGGLNSSKQPAANYSMLRYLDALVHCSRAKVELVYVRSKKDRGNKCADRLAVKAAATVDTCPTECNWDAKRIAVEKNTIEIY